MVSRAQGYLRIPVWSDDGVIKPVIDDNGRIPIQLAGIDVTLDVNLESSDITLNVSEQSPLSDIESQGYGYDGATWRKNALLWGYSDRYAERVSNLNADAGGNILASTVVPAGEVWVIEVISAQDATNNPTSVILQVTDGSAYPEMARNNSPTSGNNTNWYGRVTLKESDKVSVTINGCTAGDDLYMEVWGFKMKVAL